MTSTRTHTGNLDIADIFNDDKRLIIIAGAGTVHLLAVDRDADQRINIVFDTTELDELAAEILRLRDELDI